METLQTYKSFNSEKSIEELQYHILNDIITIENLKFELHFFNSLLDKAIFKPRIINLYERLTNFKNEIAVINKDCNKLINELNSHSNSIKNKIECDDMACDNFFIKSHEEIELKTFNFKIKTFNFKFRLFQYIESVISK